MRIRNRSEECTSDANQIFGYVRRNRRLQIGAFALRISTLFAGDFLVRVFQLLESEGALKMPEERCSLKSLGLPALKDLTFCSLKTFPDSFRMTGAGRLRPSSVRWMNWGIMSHGRCLTAQISEFPNSEKECCLSDILEKNPEAKYYLSRKQTQKLLSKGLAGVRVIGFTPETD